MQFKEVRECRNIYCQGHTAPSILVVSKSYLFRQILIQLVSFAYPKHEFIEARNVEEAGSLINGHPPKIILIDVDNLEMKDIKRVQSLKYGKTDMQLIVFTGDLTPENHEEVIQSGVNALISKNVLVDEFHLLFSHFAIPIEMDQCN